MTRIRTGACLFGLLFAATVAARALAWSAVHRFPMFDETDYLRLARDAAGRGGLPAFARAHLDGSYREDNHNPLYIALLVPWMRGDAADFPRMKLASLACALLLLGTLAAAGPWAGASALLTAGWAALSPNVAYYGQAPLPDLLFTALFVAAVARARTAGERPAAWAAFGAAAGAAWLAKGNGHFLLLAPLAVLARRRGTRLWRSPALWAALAGFAAVGAPLLWRNLLAWGDPFHNLGQKAVWVDDGDNDTGLQRSAEWARVGARWYFQRHTLAQAAAAGGAGLTHAAAGLCRAFAVGPWGDSWMLLTGAPLLAAALLGLRRAWARGDEDAVLSAAAPAAALWLAFAWLAKFGPSYVRFHLPLAAVLLPFALETLTAPLGAGGLRRTAAAIAVACGALLVSARGAWSQSPMRVAPLPPFWGPTSAWLHEHAPGGYLIDYRVVYSAWDAPPDRPLADDFLRPPAELRASAQSHGVRHAVLDLSGAFRPDALGPDDGLGPTTFLGWPRCYRAPVEPSPLVVYGSDCRGV